MESAGRLMPTAAYPASPSRRLPQAARRTPRSNGIQGSLPGAVGQTAKGQDRCAEVGVRLQGGQAAIVLVLPGGWQTSRQSAYSMLTRCVDEVHVFLDTQTQSSSSTPITTGTRSSSSRTAGPPMAGSSVPPAIPALPSTTAPTSQPIPRTPTASSPTPRRERVRRHGPADRDSHHVQPAISSLTRWRTSWRSVRLTLETNSPPPGRHS